MTLPFFYYVWFDGYHGCVGSNATTVMVFYFEEIFDYPDYTPLPMWRFGPFLALIRRR